MYLLMSIDIFVNITPVFHNADRFGVANVRGVARTVVMCRHLNETVGFTEAHSAEWGKVREGVAPFLGGGSREPPSLEFFE